MASRRMDDSRRKVLRKSLMLFKSEMSCVKDVVHHLHSYSYLNDSMRDEILGHSVVGEQIVSLHNLIPKRGDSAFDGYYLALRHTNNDVLAEVLEPHLCDPSNKVVATPVQASGPVQETKSPVTSPTDDEPPDVPPVWPDVTASPLDVAVKQCDPDDPVIKRKFADDAGVYCMKSKSMRILIINNEKFEKAKDTNEDLDTREGTDVDSTCLTLVFKQMGFSNIETKLELTGPEILKTLKKEASERQVTDEGFACFILSHGNVGSVYGTDGIPVSLEEIYKQFDGKRCRALRDKPKMFFIQACQGTMKDDTRKQTTTEEKMAKLEEQFQDLHVPKEASDSTDDTATKADMLVATATTPGYVSWRNIEHGSWFIQALVYMLKNHAHKYDLLKILTLVNRMVGQNATQKGGYKQAAEKKDTLRKDVYFFPGLGEGKPGLF